MPRYTIKVESDFRAFKTDTTNAKKSIENLQKKIKEHISTPVDANTDQATRKFSKFRALLKKAHKIHVDVHANYDGKLKDLVDDRLKNRNIGLVIGSKPDIIAKKIMSGVFSSQVWKITAKVAGAAVIEGAEMAFKAAKRAAIGMGNSVRRAKDFITGFNVQLRITERGINFIARGSGAMGTAISYIGVDSANTFIGLNHQINRTIARTGEAVEQYEALKNSIIKLAGETSMSAKQLADGADLFALAGFKTKELIEIMPTLTSLVINSGESMTEVASRTSDSIKAWNLDMKLVVATGDRMTSGMSNAKTSVALLGHGMSSTNSIFKSAGQGMSALIAQLQVMSDRGIRTTVAGNALKTIIARLVAPSKEAGIWLSRLGVDVAEVGETSKTFAVQLQAVKDSMIAQKQAVEDLYQGYKNGQSLDAFEAQLNKLGITIRKSDGSLISYKKAIYRLQVAHGKALSTEQEATGSIEKFGKASIKSYAMLKKLGFEVKAASGKLRPLNDVVLQLSKSFEGLDESERIAAAAAIAGKLHASKFLAWLDGAKISSQQFKFLGEAIKFTTSELEAQTYRQDIATTHGQEFVLYLKSLGNSYKNTMVPVNRYTVAIDQNSKQIIAATGSTKNFLGLVKRFKTPVNSWEQAINSATKAVKNMGSGSDKLSLTLTKLGTKVKFDNINDQLNELKRHLILATDDQPVKDIISIMGNEMGQAFIAAAHKSSTFSDKVSKSFNGTVGAAKSMQGKIEGTTNHMLDVMISSWNSAMFKVGESMKPILDKLFQLGTAAAQALGEVLPPMIAKLSTYFDGFNVSVEGMKHKITSFFRIIGGIFEMVFNLFGAFIDKLGEMGLTAELVFSKIASFLGGMIDSFGYVIKTLDFFGIMSDETAEKTLAAFESLKDGIKSSTSAIAKSIDDSNTLIAKSETEMASDSALAVLGMTDEISQSFENMRVATQKSSVDMSKFVFDEHSSMTKEAQELQFAFAEAITQTYSSMTTGVSKETEKMATNVTTDLKQMVTNVSDSTSNMNTNVTHDVVEMGQQVVATTGEMRTNVVTNIAEMSEGSINNSAWMATDVTSNAFQMNHNVVSESSQMATNVTSNVSTMEERVRQSTASMAQTVTKEAIDMQFGVVQATGKMASKVAVDVNQMRTIAENEIKTLSTNAIAYTVQMGNGVMNTIIQMSDGSMRAITDFGDAIEVDMGNTAVNVEVITRQLKDGVVANFIKLKDGTLVAIGGMSESFTAQMTNMQINGYNKSVEMERGVSSAIGTMRTNAVSQVQNMGAAMTSSFNQTKTQMIQTAAEIAQVRATATIEPSKRTEQSISIGQSLGGGIMNESSNSIGDFMESKTEVEKMMQNNSSNSGGFLASVNSGTWYTPPEIAEYVQDKNDRESGISSSGTLGARSSGLTNVYSGDSLSRDYTSYWIALQKSHPERYKEYTDGTGHTANAAEAKAWQEQLLLQSKEQTSAIKSKNDLAAPIY